MLPSADDGTYGYHPLPELAAELTEETKFDEALIIGTVVPDLHEQVRAVRGRPDSDPQLPPGLYWLAAGGVRQLPMVSTPGRPRHVETVPSKGAEPDHPSPTLVAGWSNRPLDWTR
jgi:hypothetical protein